MTATDRVPFRSSRFGGRESEPSCQVVKDRRLACRKALRFYVIAVVGWVQEKSDRTGLAGSKLGIPHPPPGPSPSHVGRKKPVYVPSEKRLSVAGSRFSVVFRWELGLVQKPRSRKPRDPGAPGHSWFTARVAGNLRKAVVSCWFSVLGLFSEKRAGPPCQLPLLAKDARSGAPDNRL